MIYHILSAGVYTNRYMDLLVSNNDKIALNNHFFLIIGKKEFHSSILSKITYATFDTDFSLSFIYTILKTRKEDKIICHSINYPFLIILASIFLQLPKKIIWRIWGGDLHFYKYSKISFKYRFLELCRKIVIKNISTIATPIRGDYDLAVKLYNTKAKYAYAIYPKTNLVEFPIKKQTESIKILAGNSIDDSNNHIEILRILEKFKNEKIEIIMPLSYGTLINTNTQEYIHKVISLGREIFGTKFQPLTEFMNVDSYNELLKDIDILILNHERQQALGNIFPLLAMQRKVYLRSQTTTYMGFLDKKVKVFDVFNISVENFESFTYIKHDDAIRNAEIIKKIISPASVLESWVVLFNN